MRLRCPHCHHALEIVLDAPSDPLKCPSCGSQLPGLAETAEYSRPPLQSVGHFELQERVGRGHFGDVYRARDTKLDREVAVKIPRADRTDDGTLRLFLHEARAAAQLRHANIVRVYDVDQDGDVIYIVSDFIRGITLADEMEVRRFEPRAAAELCATVAEALHFAHEAGVVHRDLKPGNVMLDDAGQPHLMDFGLAKQDSSEISITTSGDILGTPAYMSPEQARGNSRHADRRSDVYSLGVVLYQMISGEHPFEGDNATLIRRVASDEPAPLRRISEKLPRDLATICLKAMAKDPARRYATAQQMADDLRRYLRGDPIKARRASLFERGWRWTHKNRIVVLTSTAALVASALLAVALSWIAGNYKDVEASTSAAATAAHRTPPTCSVSLATEPPGATLVLYPLDEKNGEPRYDRRIEPGGVTPRKLDLTPGDYLVVAYVNEDNFHEVYRRVPEPDARTSPPHRQHRFTLDEFGVAVLAPIKIHNQTICDRMAKFERPTEATIGSFELPQAPPHRRRVPAFYLDTTETRVDEYVKEIGLPIYYQGVAPEPDFAITYVSYEDAVAYAERIGKRLLSEFEYEVAATLAGTRRFPWGNDPSVMDKWTLGTVTQPQFACRINETTVFGLYSDVAEWTTSWFLLYPPQRSAGLPESQSAILERVVRGGPMSVIEGRPAKEEWSVGPRQRVGLVVQRWKPGLGFRCARSVKPRLLAEDFESTLPPE